MEKICYFNIISNISFKKKCFIMKYRHKWKKYTSKIFIIGGIRVSKGLPGSIV